MSRKLLDAAEISKRLNELTGWKQEGDTLARTFQFPDFVTAFGFMTSVALVAESMNHHPDWTNVYNRVAVKLSTHDAGGITELDVELARRMSQLAPS